MCPNCREAGVSVFASVCPKCTHEITPALDLFLLFGDIKRTFGGNSAPRHVEPSLFLSMVDLYVDTPERPFRELGAFTLVIESGISEEISSQFIENSIASRVVRDYLGVASLGIVNLHISKEKRVTLLSWSAPRITVTGLTVEFLDRKSEYYENLTPEEKTCPFCAETVKFAAIKCKHCASDLTN